MPGWQFANHFASLPSGVLLSLQRLLDVTSAHIASVFSYLFLSLFSPLRASSGKGAKLICKYALPGGSTFRHISF